jgi:hypothetical protein
VSHRGIECEPSVEAPDDIAEHARVLHQRVGVERCHHAASAEAIDLDDDVTDHQLPTWPLALVEPVDTANDEIGAKPAAVAAEGGNRSIGGHEQRQNIETCLRVFVALEPRVRPRDPAHVGEHRGFGPAPSVDQWFPGLIECRVVPEQAWLRAGSLDPPALAVHLDEAIAHDPGRRHGSLFQ